MSTMMPPPFHYEPLVGSKSARLINLNSGSREDPIRCSLRNIPVLENQSYEALSYEWGQLSHTHPTILINNRAFRIRKNLYDALVHIRQLNEDRYLWIDALCINQSDDRERDVQVQMMGEIFASSQQVIVWTGLSDEASDVAFDIFSKMHSSNPPTRISHSRHGFILPNTINLGHADIEAIRNWISRSYWHRLWIVQEVTLAPKLEIHCGERVLAGSAFCMFSNLMICSRHTSWAKEWQDLCKHFTLFLISHASSFTQLPLRSWVIRCEHSMCSEPYDTVFALLGVAGDQKELGQLSYSMSNKDFYLQVIRKVCFDPEIEFTDPIGESTQRFREILSRRLGLSLEEMHEVDRRLTLVDWGI